MSLKPHTLLLGFCRPYRRQFLIVALFSVLATSADLLSPVIYREAVNDIAGLFVGTHAKVRPPLTLEEFQADRPEAATSHHELERRAHTRHQVAPRTAQQTLTTLLWAVVLLFGINVFSHFCTLVADQRTVQIASRIESNLIQRTFEHVLKLPLRFFNQRSSGSLAKQIDQSDQVAPVVTAFAHQIIPELICMVGVLAIMLTQSWRLSLAALITLPPYIWIVLRSSRRLETGLTAFYDLWDSVSGRIQDALGAVKTVKLSGAERQEGEQLRRASEDAYATHIQRNRLANRYLFWQTTLNYLSQALVLGYGGWLVYERQLTPGDVVMFVVYLDKLYSPIESLTGLTISLQEHFASLNRAVRLFEAGDEEPSGREPPPGPGHVEFRNVRFSYNPGTEILHGVSFNVAANKITALVGPSGAGKTTTTDLLLRLFEPDSGEVLLDGAPLHQLAPSAVRREVGVVAADGAIFRGSLLDNIRYKRPDATVEEVQAAAAAAGLQGTLARMPDGLLTEVGERGVGLSVGERQRLQIARALVGRPRVMILDEATANLDYATEAEIRATLFAPAARSTILVIAHRFSMVEHADHVIVMQAGEVIDQGSIPDLIARGGWFARFAASAGTTGEAADVDAEEPDEDEEADEAEGDEAESDDE